MLAPKSAAMKSRTSIPNTDKRMVELLATTAHESWRRLERNFVAALDAGSGACDRHPIDQDIGGHDQRPSPRAVLDEAALDQRLVQASPLARLGRVGRWQAYAPTRDRNGALCTWQMATARASAASSGCGAVAKPENQPDHLLNLRLVSFAIANHRLLDLGRGVLRNGHVPLRRGQQDRSSCLSDRHRRRHVLGKKERLNRNGVWSMDGRSIRPTAV